MRLANPPFNRPIEELGRLSDAQLVAWFDHERGEGGFPKLKKYSVGPSVSGRYLFERTCFYAGITEPADVERLWAEEQAKRPPRPKNVHVSRRRPVPR